MKKYLALFIAVIILSGALSACGGDFKGGEFVTDLAGKGYAAVTKEDGGIKRDEAGNVVVLETDLNGENVVDENGEKVTNVVGLDHAVVVGRRIECKYFSINIPEGWSDNTSYSDAIIKRDGTEDQLIISFFDDTTLKEKTEERLKLYESIKKMYGTTGKFSETETEIAGQTTTRYEGYVDPEGEDTAPVYMSFFFFEYNSIVYSCYASSNRDLTGTEDFTEIINSIEFI